jgi:hypothetical protein
MAAMQGDPLDNQKIFQKVGMFFRPEKLSVNAPRFTSNPPQLHHKRPRQKRTFSQNPLQKRPSTKQ